jgi:hypothetical protein
LKNQAENLSDQTTPIFPDSTDVSATPRAKPTWKCHISEFIHKPTAGDLLRSPRRSAINF